MTMTDQSTAEKQSPAARRQVYFYFGSLTALVYLGMPHGYLFDIATSYMLKNQLNAPAGQIAIFRLLTAIPIYIAFLFGIVRDMWNPFGLRDRGYFLIFAPLSAVVLIWMALSRLSYVILFAGTLLVMVTFRFITAAHQGLIALVGQEKLMSGRLSALWSVVSFLPAIAGAIASGYLVENMPPSRTFALVAALALAIGAIGLWKPRGVFDHAYDRPQAKRTGLIADVRRLLKHRAIYPAATIMLLFAFSPGANTPLQFYLTNELHAPDAVYGYFYAIFLLSFIPVFLLYGYLCKRFSLNTLLWWGALTTIPQYVPLVFVHSANTALLLAAPMGMMGAIANAAIYDLAMRSCPPGLQGSFMMLVDGVYQLSYRGGDIVGTAIYSSSPTHGFLHCVIAVTAVYALILPTLLLIPKDVIATADGELNPAIASEVHEEAST
jgi:Major Facilitator Superfamily